MIPNQRAIRSPRHVNWRTRVVIGMMNAGFTVAEMVRRLRTREKVLLSFIDRLERSQNPVIRHCLRHGLPADVSATLPDEETWRCPDCGNDSRYIPCVRCAAVGEGCSEPFFGETCSLDSESLGAPKEPKEPTDAPPGSWEKLQVMQKRFEAGESIFHRNDAILYR